MKGNFASLSGSLKPKSVSALGFDPGGTTGWCVLTVPATALINPVGSLHNQLELKEFGQIDCGTGGVGVDLGIGRGHGTLNMLGEADGVAEMMDLAWFRFRDSAVILEEFTLEQNNKHTDLLYPVRIMSQFSYALINQYAEMDGYAYKGVKRIFISRRADAKTVVKDQRLRHWGLYTDKGPHARDAARHAYNFLRRCRGETLAARELRWRAWPHVFSDPAIVQKVKRARQLGEIVDVKI